MLTPEGLTRIWQMLIGASDDSLQGGSIEVSDGQNSERSPIANFNVTTEGSTATLTVDAEFGEDAANHDWSTRSVLTRAGVVIDVEDNDGGRKAPGSIWTIEIDIDLLAGEQAA